MPQISFQFIPKTANPTAGPMGFIAFQDTPLSSNCSSAEDLQKEVDRLKRQLDEIAEEARQQFNSGS